MNKITGIGVAAAVCLLLAGLLAGAQAQNRGAGGAGGNAQNGMALYASKNCAQCHGMSGEGTAAGPQLAGRAIEQTNFVNQLRTPVGTMPPVPASAVSDAQAADLYAYVRTLAARPVAAAGAGAGNVENGKRIFTAYGCYECHGYAAQGGTGPRLGPHPIALANVIKELRHPTQMPPYTEKVISDAEIADVHAFLTSLPEPPKIDSIAILAK
jgi:mono/diheme cytochrome c family protein